jgi:hypothetical protein
MERAELAPVIPPFGSERFKVPRLAGVQTCALPFFCLNLHEGHSPKFPEEERGFSGPAE